MMNYVIPSVKLVGTNSWVAYRRSWTVARARAKVACGGAAVARRDFGARRQAAFRLQPYQEPWNAGAAPPYLIARQTRRTKWFKTSRFAPDVFRLHPAPSAPWTSQRSGFSPTNPKSAVRHTNGTISKPRSSGSTQSRRPRSDSAITSAPASKALCSALGPKTTRK